MILDGVWVILQWMDDSRLKGSLEGVQEIGTQTRMVSKGLFHVGFHGLSILAAKNKMALG